MNYMRQSGLLHVQYFKQFVTQFPGVVIAHGGRERHFAGFTQILGREYALGFALLNWRMASARMAYFQDRAEKQCTPP